MYCRPESTEHDKKTEIEMSSFTCKSCEYITIRKSDYIKHCYTKKHIIQSQKKTSPSTSTYNSSEKNTLYPHPYPNQPPITSSVYTSEYTCSTCYRKYKDRSGLWKHNKRPCIRQDKPYIQSTSIPNESSSNTYIATSPPIHTLNHASPQPVSHNMENHGSVSSPIPSIYAPQNMPPQMLYDYQRFPSNDLLLEFIRQNQELKNILLEEREESRIRFNEQNAKIEELSKQNIVINHNNNNNHFNLNIFLNEKCKDAISIMDFVNSLDVNTCDVEYTGKYGYVEGITKIFIEGLKQLDVYKRPIHCTDLKRETLYIKEEDKWEKDTNEKSRLKKAIGTVVRKNVQKVKMWQDENPRCNILDSKEYMLHMSIMRQSLGGGNQEKTDRNNDKIIRNIAKEVFIDKAILRGNSLLNDV